MRTILLYNTLLANPAVTSLQTTKNFTADFLFTRLVNPFTAQYIGYNRNADNFELSPTTTSSEFLQTRRLRSNAKQIFVKFSGLLASNDL